MRQGVKNFHILPNVTNVLIKELGNQISLTKGMELAVETQKDLIKAKEEIIENMKLIKSLSNDTQYSEMEQHDLKQGVYACIKFLKCHDTNSVLLNGLLLWEDIQKFTKEEITAVYIHIWLQSIKF